MSTLSTQVLDKVLGKPAQGIKVTLERADDFIGSGTTDADGRVRDLNKKESPLEDGNYQLTFYVADYFSKSARETLFPEIMVTIRVSGGESHYHIPLLLDQAGYSTYRET